MLDPIATPQSREDLGLLAQAVRRDEDGDGVADGFGGAVAEDPLGPLVPSADDALERLADDRVVRRLDDSREPGAKFIVLSLALVGSVWRTCRPGDLGRSPFVLRVGHS